MFPEFTSPHGFLRARVCSPHQCDRSCKYLHLFQALRVVQCFADDKFVSPEGTVVLMNGVMAGLSDAELPVKLEAAIALETMLRDTSGLHHFQLSIVVRAHRYSAVEMIRPHIEVIVAGMDSPLISSVVTMI